MVYEVSMYVSVGSLGNEMKLVCMSVESYRSGGKSNCKYGVDFRQGRLPVKMLV